MICPNCKTEYEEGITECVDCAVDLIAKSDVKPVYKFTSEGLKFMKFGITLLSVAFTELIVVIMIYEFYYVYKRSNGGVNGTMLENIHPLIWLLLIVKAIIALRVIYVGSKQKEKAE